MYDLPEQNHHKLYSWGANSHGQLGQGDELDRNKPNECSNLTLNIKYITGGGNHTAMLDDRGCLYSCGSNKQGQNGVEESDNNNTFKLINDIRPHIIREVACGWEFTLAVTDFGSVFSWGSNSYHQLGIEENISQSNKPLKIHSLEGKNIIKIGAGLRHSVAISEELIWAWGENRKGQCNANINEKIIKTPSKIDLPFSKIKLKSVACGSYHTLVLSNGGDCYGWGNNNRGQLAVDPLINKCLSPLKLSLPLVSQVSCGWTHNIGLTEEGGNVISWGRGDYGQLGRSCSATGCDFEPKLVQIAEPVIKVCCGSEHCLGLTENGKLYSWGWNEHGMCGLGHEDDVPFPVKIPHFQDKKLLDIGSGAGHSFCLTRN